MEEDEEDKSLLEVLEEGSLQVMEEIPKSGLERFQETFQKVIEKVKFAYRRELDKRNVELSTSVETVVRNQKSSRGSDVDTDSSDDDEMIVKTLEKEIEMARRLLEVAHHREEQSKQMIANLEADVSKLQKMVEEEEEMNRNEGLSLQELVALKRQLVLDNEKLTNENQVLSLQLVSLQTELDDITNDKKRCDQRLIQLSRDLADLKDALAEEIQLNNRKKAELDQINKDLQDKENEINQLNGELQELRQENLNSELNYSDLMEKHEELELACKNLSLHHDKVLHEFDVMRTNLVGLDNENVQLTEQLKEVDEQIRNRVSEINELEVQQRNAYIQIEQYEKENRKADCERELIEEQLSKLAKELDLLLQKTTADKHTTDVLRRENHILQRQINTLRATREKQGDVWASQLGTIKRLEKQINDNEEMKIKLRASLMQTQQDKVRLLAENDQFRQQLIMATDNFNKKAKECMLLANNLNCYQKKIDCYSSTQGNLRQNKTTIDYEVAKLKEENNYLERRLKTLTYMVENLKEELTNKEDLFAHEKQVNKKLERDCNTLRRNADERKRADHLEQSNSGRRDAQIQKLQIQFQRKTNELAQAVIHLEMEKKANADLEQKMSSFKNQLEDIQNKLRDQQKHSIEQQSAIKRYETDISLLNGVCERLEQEKKAALQKYKQSNSLRREYELLRETLLNEQLRSSVLEVEKRNPVQIHPWRMLKYTDPAAYVTLMRQQAAKRRQLAGVSPPLGNCNKLPDLQSKRSMSNSSHNHRDEDYQCALIKAIL